MALAHSSTLAWQIPWMEEPGGLQSMGSLRVGHDWATSFHFSLSCIGEGNGTPLQCSCLENPRDGGALWASVYGVAQSRTRLKRLSSSSVCVCIYIFEKHLQVNTTKWHLVLKYFSMHILIRTFSKTILQPYLRKYSAFYYLCMSYLFIYFWLC